jgi:hypothetical protein
MPVLRLRRKKTAENAAEMTPEDVPEASSDFLQFFVRSPE